MTPTHSISADEARRLLEADRLLPRLTPEDERVRDAVLAERAACALIAHNHAEGTSSAVAQNTARYIEDRVLRRGTSLEMPEAER